MKDASDDGAVRRRLAMARYAKTRNEAQAARHFDCCWATIPASVWRAEAYRRSGDIRVLQNKPRGKSGRTPPEVEEWVIAIYRESFEPARPQERCYSAAKVARLME